MLPEEYRARYGIETADWPEWNRHQGQRLPSNATLAQEIVPVMPPARNPSLEAAAQSYLRLRLESDAVSVENVNSWLASCTAEPEKAAFFRDLHLNSPEKASLLAEGLAQLPDPGSDFLGFRLISELGRGAFGRVYLAKQGDLANRSVALKVAADVFDESQSLAQLQHTNIVPIFSIHRCGNLQAVCMPYFGVTTLADILSYVESQPSLPDSGKFVVSTLNNRRASTQKIGAASQSNGAPDTTDFVVRTAPASQPEGPDSEGILHRLAGYSYVQAVLWMSSRLADGLAHAHKHGILHRDLKPANILLTDEGQPMLLDFNLSADLKGQAHRAVVGGTLPYMAPEHLEAFRGRQRILDARSDIYALGVMMYELLAGKRPFPTYNGESDATLGRLVDDRMKGAPSLRQHNKAVSPAMESIVRTCLAPKPEQRYQSAADLHEDLERHLKNLPLKHASSDASAQRALAAKMGTAAPAHRINHQRKLGRLFPDRHPRHGHRHPQPEDGPARGCQELDWFPRRTGGTPISSSTARTDNAAGLREGNAECRRVLARYGLPENRQWRDLPTVRNLPEEERDRLQEDLGGLLFLLSKGTAMQAKYYVPDSEKEERTELAMNLASLADTCYGPEHSPKALFEEVVSNWPCGSVRNKKLMKSPRY